MDTHLESASRKPGRHHSMPPVEMTGGASAVVVGDLSHDYRERSVIEYSAATPRPAPYRLDHSLAGSGVT